MSNEQKPLWERIVLFLFPTIELEGTLWQTLWREERRQIFKNKMRVFLLIGSLAFVAHFFLVDLPANVNHLNYWIMYRFGFALAFFAAFLATYTRFIEDSGFSWVPYCVLAVAASFFQAESMLWDARVPFFFAIALPIVIVSVYGFAIVPSLIFIATMFAFQWPPLSAALVNDPEGVRMIVSSYLVGIVWTIGVRASYGKDVQSFIKRQELIAERQKVIEVQKDLTNQLKGFVPSEIFNRILIYNRRHRLTMTQATDEVIRPRKKTVACVYSDIRSFTRNSKDLDSYLLERAIPNIRRMTEIAESRHGITRLVGDLILSYFDQESPLYSLLLALDCGIGIVESNNLLSERDVQGIQRNVIVAYGNCIVGNIGATDHAREITPLGPPVNLSSRLDSFLKANHLADFDSLHSVIVTQEAFKSLQTVIPSLAAREYPLPSSTTGIRDFPEVRTIISLPCNEDLKEKVRLALSTMGLEDKDQQHAEGFWKEFRYDYAV